MSNGFKGKIKIQNRSNTFRKKAFLSKAATTITLLLSTLTATAGIFTCPRASDFYAADPGPFYFTQWGTNSYPGFGGKIYTTPARYTSAVFLPTNSLTVTVTHDYPLFGLHKDTMLCNYNNGMVTVTFDTSNFILSDAGYNQVKTWYSVGSNSHSSHTCYTNAGSPEYCSVDV